MVERTRSCTTRHSTPPFCYNWKSVSSEPFIVSLDTGSSSVRALLFDNQARQMEGFGAQLPYRIQTTPDGGAEVDAEELAQLAIDCLDDLHRQVSNAGHKIA